MTTYPLEVVPPHSSILKDGFVTEDELGQSPQDFFAGSDIVWVTLSGALVLQMIPAISMFYSGATDRSSTLTLLRMPVITAAFCTVQWYLWGYVLTFSQPGDPSRANTWTWYGGHAQSVVLYRALARPVGAAGPKIPELLYAFYQGMFASFTPALICGGVIKKFKVGRFLIFIWLWSLLVYYPVARWTWSDNGFSEQNFVMDFAGGTAVHITSGTAVGAVVLFHALERHGLGFFRRTRQVIWQPENEPELTGEQIREMGIPMQDLEAETDEEAGEAVPGTSPPTAHPGRNGTVIGSTNAASRDRPQSQLHPPFRATSTMRSNSFAPPPAVLPSSSAAFNDSPLGDDAPHSLNNLVLGTMLLWIGWLGFNGGSALGGNLRAVSACAATHFAASSGACVMLVLFWIQEWSAKKWPKFFWGGKRGCKISIVHFCDGAVVGLVAITPAAGYVPVWSAGCIGIIASASIFVLKNIGLVDLMRQDPLFVFLLHTGGGFIGMFLTGCFAKQYVVGLDGYSTIPDRSVSERLRWQVTDAFMCFGFTLGMTLVILSFMKLFMRPFTGTWRLLSDNETDKLEAELEYKRRID